MPFGLTNADASFCHLMMMCIGDQQYVTLLFYLDDICIFVETADQMLDRIELMFSHLKEFNLKIKPKKSYFFQTSITFLGHTLSANGISPNPEKVNKDKDWPVPKTPKEVHSFVGLTSYYHRFIPNFAKWAGPLHALIAPASFKQKICKGEMKKSDLPKFEWTPTCQEGFDQLKKSYYGSSHLGVPRLLKTIYLGDRHLIKRPRCHFCLKKGMIMRSASSYMPAGLFNHWKNPCAITVQPKLS